MKREEVIEEAAKRLLKDVNPKHGRPVSSQLASDIRLVAGAVFEKALTPTAEEREALIALMDQPIMGTSDGRTFTEMVVDAILAAGFRRSEVVPEPSTECPQCHRPDGLHKLGCGERFGSEPQGEPSSAQEAIRVASPDTWDWDACVVCGSKDVTDRGMMVLFSAKDGVYVSRVAWCGEES